MTGINRAGAFLLVSALCALVAIVLMFRRDDSREAILRASAIGEQLTLDAAHAVLDSLKDAETGQRGFLITGNEDYLQPYRAGLDQVNIHLRELAQLVKQEPDSAELVASLSTVANEKLTELRETVRESKEGRKQAALERVQRGEGQQYMLESRALVDRIVAVEGGRRKNFQDQVEETDTQSRRSVIFGCAFLFLLVAAGTALVSLEVARERSLTASLEESERRYRNLAENLEDQVKARTQELVELNKELEAFSFSVSHDLRAPLRSIDGFSLIVMEDYADQLDEAGRDLLVRIRTAAARMATLIKSLLELSRVNRADIHREQISLSSIAENIIEGFRMQEPAREVRITIQPGMKANADPALLHIVLENLLSNAWKFTGKETVATLEVAAMVRDDKAVFLVRDNGVGFSQSAAERLYTPFQRLHAASEFDGIGIGLATVKRVIHRHGGELWAESFIGKGATFFFTLSSDTVVRD